MVFKNRDCICLCKYIESDNMISTVFTRHRCKTAKIVGSWCRQKFFSNVKLACFKISHSLTPFDIKECIQTDIGRIFADALKRGRFNITIVRLGPPTLSSNVKQGSKNRLFFRILLLINLGRLKIGQNGRKLEK